MKKIIWLFAITLALIGNISLAENTNANFNKTQINPYLSQNLNKTGLKEGVLTVPAGVSFKCVFMTPVSTETSYAGQEITLALASDFYYNNLLVAPAGSTVSGNVIESFKAKHGSLSGKLTIRFTHIYTPSGTDIPISALIRTVDGTGVLIGGKNVGFINNKVLSGADASEIKSSVPPYMGVKAGTAAAMATAVETGGGGLLKSIWDKGDDVEIPVNSRVELILTQPITITPSEI